MPVDILVELRPDPRIGDLEPKAPITDRLSNHMEEIGESLSEVASALHRRLDTELALQSHPAGAWGLNQVRLSFSLDLRSDGGVIVARDAANPGFEVALTWNAPRM
jgi:hypothetical protein